MELYERAIQAESEVEAAMVYALLMEEMSGQGMTSDEADKLIRENIAYFAIFYDQQTLERVERLYNCVHPFLGLVDGRLITTLELMEMGAWAGGWASGWREARFEQPDGPPYEVEILARPDGKTESKIIF